MANGFQNARTYWEMYEGLNAEDLSQRVHALDIWMDVGGTEALSHPYFQVSVYGRERIDTPNLVTIHREDIDGTTTWRPVHIRATVTEPNVRCIVLRVEAKVQDYTPPTISTEGKTYDDQYPTSDPPPWGVRVNEVALYGTSLGRDVRIHRILKHVVEAHGFDYSGPTDTTWQPDHLSFSDLPKDRWEAIDEVNGMLGWSYGCWDGTHIEFQRPLTGTVYPISTRDPRTTWHVERNIDETYNAVRVGFTNRRGKKREIIVHADDSPIGLTRADYLDAPDSIKAAKGAERFGTRYLNAHSKLQTYGSVSITGYDPARDDFDPLLLRPGDVLDISGPAALLHGRQEITNITLRPLDWTAEVQFGTNSKRFDLWLARLAQGTKKIKRR